MGRELNTRQQLVSCEMSARARKMRGRKWIDSVSGQTLTSINPSGGIRRLTGSSVSIYIQNELQEDQSEATIEKAYTTAETYKRILNKRVIPRFGRKSPLAIEPLEVEKWLKEVKKAQCLENPALDKNPSGHELGLQTRATLWAYPSRRVG